MVDKLVGKYPSLDFEIFKEEIDRNRDAKTYGRLILSGGEVSLEKNFLSFVSYAKDSRAYEHIRLQTNGFRFADRSFTEAVINAGIDEFYVSVQGHNTGLVENISRREGSFNELVSGLENIKGFGATLMTNTVILSENVLYLPKITDFIIGYEPDFIELSNFTPMCEDEKHLKLITPFADLLGPVKESLVKILGAGINPIVKWLPLCMLDEFRAYAAPPSPDTVIIDESFWHDFPKFGCLHEKVCEVFETCKGISHAYIERFGWEENLVRPFVGIRKNGVFEQDGEKIRSLDTGENINDAAARDKWLRLLRAPDGKTMTRIGEWELNKTRISYGEVDFAFENGAGSCILVVLKPGDDKKSHAARTARFNLSVQETGAPLASRDIVSKLIAIIQRLIEKNDDGRLEIPIDPQRRSSTS